MHALPPTPQLGYWWLLAAVVASFLQNLLLQHHDQIVIRAGLRAKGALATVAYRHALPVAAAPTSGGRLAQTGWRIVEVHLRLRLRTPSRGTPSK